MAKYYGKIGFYASEETKPGVWSPFNIVEKPYSGDIIRLSKSIQSSNETTNDDLRVDVRISIIADPFVNNNIENIRYVKFMGVKWKVTSIEPQTPRLILSLGGVYNGQ